MSRKVIAVLVVLLTGLALLQGAPPSYAQEGTPTPAPADPTEVPAEVINAEAVAPEDRVSFTERMTPAAQRVGPNSPYYNTTWVSYYGRPGVEIMGILGEYDIDELVPRLRAQAAAYDEANGPDIGVQPAFHLVYGMATSWEQEDNSYLYYLNDETTMAYIERAQEEGFAVILDIQIGALNAYDAIEPAFRFLQYPNVHLALDPEFAMRTEGQERPGNPIGYVTTEEINAVQAGMREYMKANDIPGRRILIVHQFLFRMIRDLNDVPLDKVYKIDLTFVADGWGDPQTKIGKYNNFYFRPDSIDKTYVYPTGYDFTGMKMFYRWDIPMLTEREALGIDRRPNVEWLEVAPNFIIYQ